MCVDGETGLPMAAMARESDSSVNHLVIVCCHGIWLGGPSGGTDESEWLLAPFQKGESPTFVKHIKAGLNVLKADDQSVVCFSGGPTRKETLLSEAQSYANLAAKNGYWGLIDEKEAHRRILVEARALDSYYNVLFSLLLYWRTQGYRWPERLTIVSHAFKRQRLVDLHCSAIGFPLCRVSFVGVDPPAELLSNNEAALRGIQEAVEQWRADPNGVGEILAGKRCRRNPHGISQALFEDAADLARSGLSARRIRADCDAECLAEDSSRPWQHG